MIRSDLAFVVHIPVPCGNCGKEFTEAVYRLVRNDILTCPACGTTLNIDNKEWAEFRNRLEELHVGKFSPIAPVK